MTKDDYLYYLVNYEYDLHQIGVTRLLKERLQQHARNGFFLVQAVGPLDAKYAMRLELKIKRFLGTFDSGIGEIRDVDFDGKLKLNFSGRTETWRGSKYRVQDLDELISDMERGFPIDLQVNGSSD